MGRFVFKILGPKNVFFEENQAQVVMGRLKELVKKDPLLSDALEGDFDLWGDWDSQD